MIPSHFFAVSILVWVYSGMYLEFVGVFQSNLSWGAFTNGE